MIQLLEGELRGFLEHGFDSALLDRTRFTVLCPSIANHPTTPSKLAVALRMQSSPTSTPYYLNPSVRNPIDCSSVKFPSVIASMALSYRGAPGSPILRNLCRRPIWEPVKMTVRPLR
ncbi:MAG: hypothetical protein QXG32_04150 [Candidatus Bathyarchaeia archaeon]